MKKKSNRIAIKLVAAFTALYLTALGSTAIWAMPPTADDGLGAPVKHMPLVSNISTWQALDNQRLVVSLNAKQNYLVTLANQCHTLPAARSLGISASGNNAYAGFDYITADGQRCGIHKINRISLAEKSRLTKI